MTDDRFHDHKNCRILGVYKRIHGNIKILNEYLIEIAVEKEDSCFPDYFDVKLNKDNLYGELKELVSGKRKRVYAAHGMTDIDFFRSENGNKYCIEWSPSEASYHYFYFDAKDFIDNFVESLKSDEE